MSKKATGFEGYMNKCNAEKGKNSPFPTMEQMSRGTAKPKSRLYKTLGR